MKSDLPPAMILCGGVASRLALSLPILRNRCYANGEPFLAHQLHLLRKNGISKVVLCTGRFSSLIREYAGDGSRFGIELEYSRTARFTRHRGRIRKALPLVGDNFFTVYGDSIYPAITAASPKRFWKAANSRS